MGYCISPFAVMCMFTAIILNRILVLAAARQQRPRLPRLSNVLLRLLALYALYCGSYGVWSGISAYDTTLMGNLLGRLIPWDFATYSKRKFFWYHFADEVFVDSNTAMGPSPEILKPLFLSLCLGQIMETFIAALNDSAPIVENSLTLFEYSLAFQEVQTASRPAVEVLRIATAATLNQAYIHVLGLFGLEKYRLIPSAFIGGCVFISFAQSYMSGRIFYYPMTVVISFTPQLITFAVILLCGFIFLSAAVLKGSISDLQFSTVTSNLSSLNISMRDDFYTTLVNLGEFLMNAAGKTCYVEELNPIALPTRTFIEQDSTGYGNELSNTPQADDRQKLTRSTWILFSRLTNMKRLATQFADLIWSIVTGRKPNFLHAKESDESDLPTEPEIDIDIYSDDWVNDNYISLMKGPYIEEKDSSLDYLEPNSETEDEYCSDGDSDVELLSSREIVELLSEDPANMGSLRIMGAHLSECSSLTRSRYKKQYLKSSSVLKDLISEKRQLNDQDQLGVCVICHTNSRQVILWPCRCLALCEACRVSLLVRGFSECVCCRQKVEGFSKVYVP